MLRSLGTFLLVACLVPNGAAQSDAGEKGPQAKIGITYDPPPQPLPNLNRITIGPKSPAQPGKNFETEKTIGELIGSQAQNIKVLYYSKKHWENFEQVQAVLRSVLAAKSNDGMMYGRVPWAEGVNPSIVAVIQYKNKDKGILELAGKATHLCFQDQKGVHWWARLTLLPALPKK